MRKGLSDLRTATSGRLHAKPPQKGTEHLNLYLLDKEAQRLRQELAGLKQRQKRIEAHLAEIRKAMARLEQETPKEDSSLPPAVGTNPPAQDYRQRQWRKMAVEY